MCNLLFFECLNGRHRRIGCIAIIRTAAAIELAIEIFWSPRAQAIAPAIKLRLFVQMAIHQDRLTIRTLRARSGHLEKENRSTAGQSNNFQLETSNFLCLDPSRSPFDHFVQIARLRPIGIKGGRFSRDFDVVAQLAYQIVIPGLTHRGQDLRGIEHGNGSIHYFALTLRRHACSRGSV